ncbi:hypothetical protein ACLIYM_24680 [Streptomyces fenghuangensis]|uniref:DUF7919 domain-containing protein n=1 Tax=Streptomyces chitinivorans TaxID=1257027 RepID=A0ABW7HRR8_9ACTN|nr:MULTISPECIES: hypothetical protein [Streptomyces]MCG3044543.1 hypothetical protein [Streptomyces sp. ICN903]MDH2411454.1 hypothetical protein [Streptomyces chitinivorans]
MTYYADLTPYSYDEVDSSNTLLNVGWLSREHGYRTGEAPEGLIEALAKLAERKVNMQRGMHFCELCPSFEVARENTSRGNTFIGSGEIRVPGREGAVYAAPAMIVHYVESHAYLPPEEFIESVLALGSS